jgi:beta-N-acetylhexosaminidase
MRRSVVLAALALTACTSSATGARTSSPVVRSPSPSTPAASSAGPSATHHPSTPATHASSTAPPSPAQHAFDAMTERQRVGQLLMVDCPSTGVSSATRTALNQNAVGSVILDGTSSAGLQATRAVTDELQRLAPKGVGLLVATDQEGGIVQRLQGPGFSRIPSAVAQGTYPTSVLYSDARAWGRELKRAGVSVNLAPVLDTVPAGFGSNPPIGDLDREYGHHPGTVELQGNAVARGMTAAGVDVTVKHFPGLGRVRGNTDTTSGVTDSVTTRDDPYLAPFRAAVRVGVAFVMMSTASYSRIDPGTPAAFSRVIVTGMLRGSLGFRGLIISDDVGAAAQVADTSVGQRAVRFVAAGGDVVLTVDANQAGTMTSALLHKAETDPGFKRQVDKAALLVLQEKQRRGLLG